MDEFIDKLKGKQKLNLYQQKFLEYVKGKDGKMKQYVVQKFASYLKENIPDGLIEPEFELCEIKTQKFIDEFLKKINDNPIKQYLTNRKYIQMSLMEKLVIYVILNDMIKDNGIYTNQEDKISIIQNFNELISKCKFKSHRGFLN